MKFLLPGFLFVGFVMVMAGHVSLLLAENLPDQKPSFPDDAQETTVQRLADARELWESAFRQIGQEREIRQLHAIEILLEQDTKAQAKSYLDSIIEWRLKNSVLSARRDVLRAHLVLLDGHPDKTLRLLQSLGKLPAGEEPRALDLRAEALLASGAVRPSLDTRMLLAGKLTEPEAVRQNEIAIWNTVLAVDLDTLRQWAGTPDVALRGWLALAEIEKTVRGMPDRDSKGQEWARQYPGHPGRGLFIASGGLPLPTSEVELDDARQTPQEQ